jgi:hypothetical protein
MSNSFEVLKLLQRWSYSNNSNKQRQINSKNHDRCCNSLQALAAEKLGQPEGHTILRPPPVVLGTRLDAVSGSHWQSLNVATCRIALEVF